MVYDTVVYTMYSVYHIYIYIYIHFLSFNSVDMHVNVLSSIKILSIIYYYLYRKATNCKWTRVLTSSLHFKCLLQMWNTQNMAQECNVHIEWAWVGNSACACLPEPSKIREVFLLDDWCVHCYSIVNCIIYLEQKITSNPILCRLWLMYKFIGCCLLHLCLQCIAAFKWCTKRWMKYFQPKWVINTSTWWSWLCGVSLLCIPPLLRLPRV